MDGRKGGKGTAGCGLFFMLFLLYLLWPLILLIVRAVFNAAAGIWPSARIPVLIIAGAFFLWVLIKRSTYGRGMPYEKIQKLVWSAGARYARQQGLGSGSASEGRFEAPGYTVSDFIDRYGISPQMDRELIREYRKAFK